MMGRSWDHKNASAMDRMIGIEGEENNKRRRGVRLREAMEPRWGGEDEGGPMKLFPHPTES